MDDILYDTSWNVYSIQTPTPSFRALFEPPTSTTVTTETAGLEKHASAFLASLSRKRPRYEEQEEKEKLGGLRTCTWSYMSRSSVRPRQDDQGRTPQAVQRKRKRPDKDNAGSRSETSVAHRGIAVNMIYDKTTYKFILFTTSSSQQPNLAKSARTKRTISPRSRPPASSSSGGANDQEYEATLLLAKCNPSTFKAFTAYLHTKFSVAETHIHPVKLPGSFLQSTLEAYVSTVYEELTLRHNTEGSHGRYKRSLPPEANLKSIIGTVRTTISFSPPVAPMLKTLDIEIPNETLITALTDSDTDHTGKTNRIMTVLATWIENRTGLKLPVRTTEHNSSQVEEAEKENQRPSGPSDSESPSPSSKDVEGLAKMPPPAQPMRLSRVTSAAYALSSEGRLKFASKVMKMCEDVEADDGESEPDMIGRDGGVNILRKANHDLLCAMLREANRQVDQVATV